MNQFEGSSSSSSSRMEIDYGWEFDFEDFFPSMVVSLGAEGFIGELCSGFCLLMDSNKGVITFESLKTTTMLLGLEVMDEELVMMMVEGDLDGDGVLSQMEFCILMFRLSPGLMMDQGPRMWLDNISGVSIILRTRRHEAHCEDSERKKFRNQGPALQHCS